MKTNKAETGCGKQSCFGVFYDILAQIISLLDFATDIIVCLQYYQNDRMVFFGISFTILCLALIAYDITFMAHFSNERKPEKKICLFLAILPLSPLLPYILYFTADPNAKISIFIKNICCFDISLDDRTNTSSNISKLRQFMEQKVMKHIGFIVEALVEAFPQAILQMAAIVIYNEANIIAIISILISMLSVASKSFVFSIATALTMKQLLFNWLSAVVDFFGIFFVVSWAFYVPKDEELQDAFNLIHLIWLYRLYLCTLPLIAITSIVAHFVFTDDIISSSDNCCSRIVKFLMITVMWVCGIIASTLISEIITWVWPAGTLWYLGTTRFPQTKAASEFYFTIIGWINNAEKHHVGSKYKGCTSYTKQQDKMMRISSFHAVILNYSYIHDAKSIYYEDAVCKAYLEKELETQYMNVTMEGLRVNSYQPKYSEFLRLFFYDFYAEIWCDIWDDVKRECKKIRNGESDIKCNKDLFLIIFFTITIGLITFVCGPMYLISRIWTLFFPVWIVLYLYFGYGVNIWNTPEIDLFQVVMITVYMLSCCIIWILFYMNCCEQYVMHHILPATKCVESNIGETKANSILKDVMNYYYGIVVIPIRKAMVIEHFGPDLGPIILSYLPAKDEYESNENAIRVRTV